MSAHNWARRWVRDDEIRIFRCWTTLGSAAQLWARPLSSRVCGLASGVSCQLLAASASTCVTYARLPIEAPGGNPTSAPKLTPYAPGAGILGLCPWREQRATQGPGELSCVGTRRARVVHCAGCAGTEPRAGSLPGSRET